MRMMPVSIKNSMENRTSTLNELPFLATRLYGSPALHASLWKEIHNGGEAFRLERGSHFTPKHGHFYCIEKGTLRLEYADQNDGRLRLLTTYEKDAIFNLPWALQNKACSYSLHVLENALVWSIPAETLLDPSKFINFPALAQNVIHLLSSSLLTFYGLLTFLEGEPFLKRFCRYLALNIRKHGSSGFSIDLTQKDCACMLGVHRATLARAVRQLKKDGVLESFTKDGVRVRDMEKLFAMAGL